jgi:hypothetical protein
MSTDFPVPPGPVMNTFWPDLYFSNASFCSGDIYEISGLDVGAVAAGAAGVVTVGGVSDSFFTTVVYLRISCDNVVAIYQIIHYHLTGEYISIYRK